MEKSNHTSHAGPAGRPVRLLECIRQGQIGGGESHLLSLVENLDRSRFEPIVLSFTDGPMVERLLEMGVQTHIIPTVRPFDVTKWREVKEFIRKEEIALVHAHGTRACSNVIQAAQALHIPVVYTVHGWSFHPGQHPLVHGVRVLGEKFLTSRTTVNISVSSSNRQTGSERIRNFDSLVISNGIDLMKFSPGGSFKNIREELGIPADAVLVLFLARFTAHKQPLALIRAFREAVRHRPSMHLLLVGDGDEKAEALDMVEKSGIGTKVTFQPFRQDVPDVLAAADIYVLPSLWEGLPIGLLEAMSMGKAVIATNVDGTREVMQDGENGLMIAAGDIPALTGALERLGEDKVLRSSLGKKALETVRQRFDAAGMTRAIEDVYTDVLKGSKHKAKNGR